MKKVKTKTTSQLKKKLDAIFSKYIRERDNGQCFTCHLKREPKEMQNGHFVPRQYLATRYDERNNNCQCYACNMIYNGQPSMYAIKLKAKYGNGIIEELERLRHIVTKDYPYEEKIREYTEKYNTLIRD